MAAGEIPKDRPRSSLLSDDFTSVGGLGDIAGNRSEDRSGAPPPDGSARSEWIRLAFLGVPGDWAPVTVKAPPTAVLGTLPEVLPWAGVAGVVAFGAFAIGKENREHEARVQGAMERLGLPETREGRRQAQAYVYAIDMFSLQETRGDAATQDSVAQELARYVKENPWLFDMMRKGNRAAAEKLLDKFHYAWDKAAPTRRRGSDPRLTGAEGHGAAAKSAHTEDRKIIPEGDPSLKPLPPQRVLPPHDGRDGDVVFAMANQGASDQAIKTELRNRESEREGATAAGNGNGKWRSGGQYGDSPAPPRGSGAGEPKPPAEWQTPELNEVSLGTLTLGGQTQDEHDLYFREHPDIDRHSMDLLSHVPSMAYLRETGQQPGSHGVLIDGGFKVDSKGNVIVDEQFRDDLWTLSQAWGGIEVGARVRTGGTGKTEVMIQSGDETGVDVAEGWRSFAHIHPNGDPEPSPEDIEAANYAYAAALEVNPNAEPEESVIVAGPSPGNYTKYGPEPPPTHAWMDQLPFMDARPGATGIILRGEVKATALYDVSLHWGGRQLAVAEVQEGGKWVTKLYSGGPGQMAIVPNNSRLIARIQPYTKPSDKLPSLDALQFLNAQYRALLDKDPNAEPLRGLIRWGTGRNDYTEYFASQAGHPPLFADAAQRSAGRGLLFAFANTDFAKANFASRHEEIATAHLWRGVAVISPDGASVLFNPEHTNMDEYLSWLKLNARDMRVGLVGGTDGEYAGGQYSSSAAMVAALEAGLRAGGFQVVFKDLYGARERLFFLNDFGQLTVTDAFHRGYLVKYQFEPHNGLPRSWR